MSSSILSGEFLQGFFESYPAAVAMFELDGTMVFVNQPNQERGLLASAFRIS